jgi:polysaccharide pyruvyl transferase WcaK-like protein
MGDDSFGLPPADPALVNAYLSRRGLSPGRFLAVNLRVGSYVGATQDYVRPFAKLVSRLARHYELPLVVVPLALNEDDSDITSGHQLARMVEGSSVHVLDDPELDARLVKGILGKAHAAVGVSYHFCTFALSQGVPAICTFAGDYYGQKARGLAGFWKDSRLLLALEGCGTPTALAAATALFDDEPFRDALRARAARAVSRWARIFDHVTETALLGPGARAWVSAVFAVEEQG